MGAWFSSRHNPCCVTNRQLAFSPLASVRVFFLLLEFPTVPRAASRSAEPVTANCRHLNFALASPHRPEGGICPQLQHKTWTDLWIPLARSQQNQQTSRAGTGLCTGWLYCASHCREVESGAGTVRRLRRGAGEPASNEKYSCQVMNLTVKVQAETKGNVLFRPCTR